MMLSKSWLHVALVLLLAPASMGYAAVPSPPVLCLEESGCPDSTGTYTLSSIGEVPFQYETPIPPRISSEATVTPATLAANKVDGRRLFLESGSYGSQNFSNSDMEIVCVGVCNFSSLSFSSGAQRIIFSVSNKRSGEIQRFTLPEWEAGVSDILIDGMNMENGNARVFLGGDRVAILNSRLDAGSGSFAASTFNGSYEDIIIANTEVIAPGSSDAVVRLQGVSRLIFVDNRVKSSGGYNTFRIHADGGDVRNALVARNQFEGTRLGIVDQCCGSAHSRLIHNVWFENNDFYVTASNVAAINTSFDSFIQSNGNIGYLSLKDNRAYGPVSVWISGSLPGYDIESNSIGGWRSPPAWSFR